MAPNYSQELQAEVQSTPQPGLLLRTVHAVYHEQFARWFGIMAPTSLMAMVVLVLADQRVREIFEGIPRGELTRHYLDILAALAVRAGGFFLSWLLGVFALAAVATAVNDLDAEDENGSWIGDSYQRAREHLGSLSAIAFITFGAFLIGMAAFGFVDRAAFRIFGTSHFIRYNYGFWLIGMVVTSSIVSWLGAAIPLVMKGDTRVWAALRRSVELSSGYEGALFLLVVESVVGSYIAWYAVIHGLPWLLPPALTYSAWYVWILNLVGVLASASVEPPLFIGFSLLVNPERLQKRII